MMPASDWQQLAGSPWTAALPVQLKNSTIVFTGLFVYPGRFCCGS
jgi:hypothetical protein